MRETTERWVVALALGLVASSVWSVAQAADEPVVDAPGDGEVAGDALGDGEPSDTTSEEFERGDVAYDVWYGRFGQSLGDVPLGAEPDDGWDLAGVLESPVDAGDQYAMRMRALLTPAESGTYRFAVAGDDDVRLFFDPNGDDPAGARRIAYVAGWTTYRQFDRYTSQTSEWFELTAGTAYYIEVIGKEGSSGDHFSVAWQRPGGELTMVPAEVLEATDLGSGGWRAATPYGLPGAPMPITNPGWTATTGTDSIELAWDPVAGAVWYEVRLEGAGQAVERSVDEPMVEFVGLVPETRYLIEVAPANAAARHPAATTVRVTEPAPYPVPVAAVPGDRPTISYDRWDTGWWTLTSVPFLSPPVSTGTLATGLETPPMLGDHHAARIRAVLTPTVTGEYTFHLAADDDARLLFNPDGVAVVGAEKIAYVSGWTEQYQWDRYRSQTSATHLLHAGRSYYIEAMSVHALGLDHLEVGWSHDGGPITVVPAEVLRPTTTGATGWRTDDRPVPPVPGRPDVEVEPDGNGVRVDWTVPADGGAVDRYEVRLVGDGVDRTEVVDTVGLVFADVPGGVHLTATVLAWNVGGPGEPGTSVWAPPAPTETTTTTTPPTTTTTTTATTTTTTTTTPPTTTPPTTTEPSGPVDDAAVIATGTGECSAVHVSASSVEVDGDVRSNTDVAFHVGRGELRGSLRYGRSVADGSYDFGRSSRHEHRPGDVAPRFSFHELAEGQVGVARFHHHGRLQVHGTVEPGIHVVDGDVVISGDTIDLDGVTILATGRITVSGSSIRMTPAAHGLPTLYSAATGCGRAAIQVSGSDAAWSGPIVAPDGLIRFSGSHFSGHAPVHGAAVRMSCDELRLGVEPPAVAAEAERPARRTPRGRHGESLAPTASPSSRPTEGPAPDAVRAPTTVIGRDVLAELLRGLVVRGNAVVRLH